MSASVSVLAWSYNEGVDRGGGVGLSPPAPLPPPPAPSSPSSLLERRAKISSFPLPPFLPPLSLLPPPLLPTPSPSSPSSRPLFSLLPPLFSPSSPPPAHSSTPSLLPCPPPSILYACSCRQKLALTTTSATVR